MTKRRPRNIAASVRQRLMQLSRERREDFQLVLTRYGLEQLLYRLTQSPHAGQFVLKGAVLFQLTVHRAGSGSFFGEESAVFDKSSSPKNVPDPLAVQ